jgi:hypothetical protein
MILSMGLTLLFILLTLDHEPGSQILEYLHLVTHLLFVPAHEGHSMISYIRKIFDCWDPGFHSLFRMAVECRVSTTQPG